ncbi:MAG: deoxyhypusine synthase [Thermoplasmata archaeon]|nr:deoxyhypusine synthase [Thermoplasmata archaeon]
MNKNILDQRIVPSIRKIDGIENLVSLFSKSKAYNAGRLYEACKIYEKMLEDNTTICLTLSGAFTPTGLGGFVISLIEKGLVDFIISTGANLYHDMHFALDLPVYQGDFRVRDDDLLKRGIVRIYDIFIPKDTLLKTDDFIRNSLKDFSSKEPISSADLHKFLGEILLKKSKHPEYSILATAAKHDLPIYTPSPGDSSIALNTASLKIEGKKFFIDPDKDVLETSAIVFSSKKNGAIEIGGGAPKNFYMQTQPMLDQILNLGKKGHDYFIQITTDAPQWGGLSGATPNEAVSWGKINPKSIGNSTVVYCDFTIASPILFSYILGKYKEGKELKRLYKIRNKLLIDLKSRIKIRL